MSPVVRTLGGMSFPPGPPAPTPAQVAAQARAQVPPRAPAWASAGAPVPPPAGVPGRPWWSRAGTVGAVSLAASSASVAAAYSGNARPADDPMIGLDILAMVLGLVAAGFLVARRRAAIPLTLGASALAVVLPLDPVTALVALPWVFATAARRTAWWCTGAVAAATAVSLWRDGTRPAEHRVFAATDQATGHVVPAAPAVLVVLGVLCVAVAVAAGLVRASRAQAARAVADMEGQVARADTLTDRMTRQEERELIAREVHDTVAHHISLISLQASALEVQRGAGDAQVQAAAQQVRSSAQQAIAEMRGLITTLRAGEDPHAPGATLDDLAGLLDGARRQGRWVTSSVWVTDGGAASPALTRAAFRIVQEGLTNALKHAPGLPVEVTVRASPAEGVRIRVLNPMPAACPAPGTGSGLVGMRERAALAGGTVDARVEQGWHVLDARLPWEQGPGQAVRSGV